MLISLECEEVCLQAGCQGYLEDDSRQCGLIVSILVRLRLRVFLPVLLVCFQGLPQPPCDIGLHTGRVKERISAHVSFNETGFLSAN